MIAQSQTSTSFQSLARYLERPKTRHPERPRIAWTTDRNLVCTASLQDIAWEMTITARASERVQKPVYHLSVSWAPEDGPTRGQMTAVADKLMHTLSLAAHQSVYVAHGDEAYRHLHIMSNRVHPDTGKAQPMYRKYRAIQATLRKAEVRYGFRQVPGHLYQLPGQSPPERSQSLSKGAYKALCRKKTLPFQLLVQRAAGHEFDDAAGWQDLHARLARHGLSLRTRRTGLLVTDGHEYAKSSSIGPNVSLRKLEARFGETFALQRARDLPAWQWERSPDHDLGH